MHTVYENALEKLTDGLNDQEMKSMLTDLSKAPELYQPSKFWTEYLTLNIKQLSGSGAENFKQTVNHNYFNWSKKFAAEQCANIASQLGLNSKFYSYLSGLKNSSPVFTINDTSKSEWGDWAKQSPILKWCLTSQDWSKSDWHDYVKFVCYLWEFARQTDNLHLLDKIEEPSLGNPLAVMHRGHLISQDISNSVMEVNAATTGYKGKLPTNLRIGELGAGYGRNAYVLLKSFAGAKVTIIDIPPALHLSQWYLSKLFPERKVFKYRHFDNFEAVRDQFESSSIAFLLPHQVELLPDSSFDLFLNISSLHEMLQEQINMWFDHINRLCTNGYFYHKQWISSTNPFDDIVIKRETYPAKDNWLEIFNRQCPVQTQFFEALYSIS